MIITRVRYRGRLVRLGGLGPKKYQMFQWAQVAVQAMKDRVAMGIGSDDNKMPPLTKRYAIRKTRAGLRNFRNLRGTGEAGGNMLDWLRVTYADESRAKIDITGLKARQKALGNERRAPWFGLSPQNVRTVTEAAGEIFKTNIDAIAGQFTRGPARGRFAFGSVGQPRQSRGRMAA